jgi:RNA polymerase primary sigma factor
LVSEGNIGLMHAVERFDPRRGGKLSTYGVWWIKQSIKRALANQSKTVRLPIHMVDKIARMRRISVMLAEALGREPTDEEIAEELGLSRRKVAMLQQASQRPTSLDAPISEGDTTQYSEIISDDLRRPGEIPSVERFKATVRFCWCARTVRGGAPTGGAMWLLWGNLRWF